MADVRLERSDGAERRAASAGRTRAPSLRSRSDRQAASRCHASRRSRSCRRSTPASASASEITLLWPVTLGAVKPTLCDPSLLTADPRMTARMESPSRERVVEPLQHDHADAVAEDRALRARVERAAVAIGRVDAALVVTDSPGLRVTSMATPPASAMSDS